MIDLFEKRMYDIARHLPDDITSAQAHVIDSHVYLDLPVAKRLAKQQMSKPTPKDGCIEMTWAYWCGCRKTTGKPMLREVRVCMCVRVSVSLNGILCIYILPTILHYTPLHKLHPIFPTKLHYTTPHNITLHYTFQFWAPPQPDDPSHHVAFRPRHVGMSVRSYIYMDIPIFTHAHSDTLTQTILTHSLIHPLTLTNRSARQQEAQKHQQQRQQRSAKTPRA
jgi:hypothetical protein